MGSRSKCRLGRAALVAFASVGFWSLAAAQDDTSDLPGWHPLRADRVAEVRKPPPSTMSEGFYGRLLRVHELLESDAPRQALELLDDVRPDRIGKYEAAQLYHTSGFVYAQLGHEAEAFDAFKKCLELDALPSHQQQGVVYSVAGYHAGNERYEESNATLLLWFRYEASPFAEAYVAMGANFAQQEMMRDALPYVVRANQLAEKPNRNWRNLQLAIHVRLGQYADAIEVLKDNIGIWPGNVRDYVALSGLYTETGQDESALAALSLAWRQGILLARSDILNLVRLNLFLDNPARAAGVLREAMDRGHVEEDSENLELLLNAWTMARETDRAVETIDKLARLAEDGDVYHRKALLLNDMGKWEDVVESCRMALATGGLENPGEVWLLKGVALVELRQFSNAIGAFENAKRSKNDSIRSSAATWLDYVRERSHGSS